MTLVVDAVRHFHNFELDAAAFELRRRGRPVKLEGRAMSLLMLLLERPGELVTRTEIITRLWGSDTFVDVDAGINTAVRKLRAALRDSADNPKIIKTVQGKGYRFIGTLDAAPTERPQHPPAVEAAPPRAPMSAGARLLRRAGLVVAGVLVVGLGVALAPPPPHAPRVQVLSLSVREGGPVARAFADRLGGEITDALNDTGVRTSAPPRSFVGALRPQPPDLAFGGVASQEGGVLRTRIYLADTQAGLTLWTREFTGRVGQEEQLADEAAAAASETIYMALEPRKQKGLKIDPAEVALHIRGGELSQRPPMLSPLANREPFEQLVRRAPNFALGHGELARTLAQEASGHPPGPERVALQQRAEAEARTAIRIDASTAGQAYGALGLLQQQRFPDDHLAAERLLREGLQANPDYAFLNMRICDLLSDVGRSREAVWYCLRAVSQRPRATSIAWKYADALESAGEPALAMLQIEKAARFDPNNDIVRQVRFRIAAIDGSPADATRLLHDPVFAPREVPAETVVAVDLYLKARATRAPADLDRASRALAASLAVQRLNMEFAAPAVARLGDAEATFDLLARAPLERYSRQGITRFLLNPALAPLRTDDRFWTAAARLGLVKYWLAAGAWPDFCSDASRPIDCRGLATRAERVRPAGSPYGAS